MAECPNEPVREIFDGEAWSVFHKMQLDGHFCDATLKSMDGGVFKVHRVILSGCSPYFMALFGTNSVQESRDDFTLPGITAENLQSIIQFAYGGKVHLTLDNATDLMVDADQFNVLPMVDQCSKFIVEHLTPEDCIPVRSFAKNYFFANLERAAHRYLMYHFVSISKSEAALDLSLEQLVDILASDELNVRDEHVLWEFVLRWIARDPAERECHLSLLMRHIRLGLLDSQYIMQNVKVHPLVRDNAECRKLAVTAFKYINVLEAITDFETVERPMRELGRPRIPHDIMFAFGGWSSGSATNALESYDTRADRWITVEDASDIGPRAYHGCAVLNKNIYVIGGFDGTEYFNNCRCFNTVTKTWSEVSPMNCRRCYVSVAVVSGVIYAMGGYDGQHRLNTAEKYDVDKNQWSYIRPMSVQRSDASAATLDGRVYIVGGFNGQQCVNTAEMYVPETDEWNMITSMRANRSGVSCAAYHGSIYAAGGFNGVSRLRSAERYDPLTRTWTQIPDMHSCRSNFALVVIDDLMFAIGGYNGMNTIAAVECYEHQKNEWLEVTEMSIYRSALDACVVPNVENVGDYIIMDRDHLVEDKRQRLQAFRRSMLMVDRDPARA